VASGLAVAGLPVTAGQHLLLAESDADFTEAILLLIRDEGLRVRLARQARQWAETHLTVTERVASYERLYLTLLGRQPAVAASRVA
jgi:hypothetical protein